MIATELIQRLIQLRALIGFLGERNQFNWWDTQFLGKTSFGYLELNFPRTTFSSALHSVTAAAKKVHDDRIGKGFVYHLFRLPFRYEQPIANYLHSSLTVSQDGDITGDLFRLLALPVLAGAIPFLRMILSGSPMPTSSPVFAFLQPPRFA